MKGLVWDSHTCESGDVSIEKTGSTWKCIQECRFCSNLRSMQALGSGCEFTVQTYKFSAIRYKKKKTSNTYQRLQMLNWILIMASTSVSFCEENKKICDVLFCNIFIFLFLPASYRPRMRLVLSQQTLISTSSLNPPGDPETSAQRSNNNKSQYSLHWKS